MVHTLENQMFLTEIADADVRGSPPYRLESDSLSHVSKLGIKLKTSARLPRNEGRRISAGYRDTLDGRANKPHYIENIVVPLRCSPSPEQTIKNASMFRSASAGRIKSSFPVMRNTASAHGYVRSMTRTPSTHIDRYTSSQALGPRAGSQNLQSEGRVWNRSAQAMRFQLEQMELSRCRILKRTSELQTHRMEHHYYMSGRQLWLQGRYDVEEEALQGLRELSQARKGAANKGQELSMLYEVNKYFGRNREREMTTPTLRPPTSQSITHSSVRQTPVPSNPPLAEVTRTAEHVGVCSCEGPVSSTGLRNMENEKPMSGKTKTKMTTPVDTSAVSDKQGSQGNLGSHELDTTGPDLRPDATETQQAWQPKEDNDYMTNLDFTKTDEEKKHGEKADSYQSEAPDGNEDPTSKASPTQLENTGNGDAAEEKNFANQIVEKMEENAIVD